MDLEVKASKDHAKGIGQSLLAGKNRSRANLGMKIDSKKASYWLPALLCLPHAKCISWKPDSRIDSCGGSEMHDNSGKVEAMKSYYESWFIDLPGKDKDGFITVPLNSGINPSGTANGTLTEGQCIYSQGGGHQVVKDGILVERVSE